MPTTNGNLVKLHVACKNIPLNIHLFKVNKRNTRKRCEKQIAKNKEITDFSFERLIKLPLNKK